MSGLHIKVKMIILRLQEQRTEIGHRESGYHGTRLKPFNCQGSYYLYLRKTLSTKCHSAVPHCEQVWRIICQSRGLSPFCMSWVYMMRPRTPRCGRKTKSPSPSLSSSFIALGFLIAVVFELLTMLLTRGAQFLLQSPVL